MSIKHLKPNMGKKSHYKQGYYDVNKSSKYEGPKPCIYRSGLEYKFMVWCELNPSIITWSSEPYYINYSDLSSAGKKRKYYIDFTIVFKSGAKWLVEVKPYKQTIDVKNFGKVLKRLKTNDSRKEYLSKSDDAVIKNFSKWYEAKKYCDKIDSKFVIITENFFKNKLK